MMLARNERSPGRHHSPLACEVTIGVTGMAICERKAMCPSLRQKRSLRRSQASKAPAARSWGAIALGTQNAWVAIAMFSNPLSNLGVVGHKPRVLIVEDDPVLRGAM